MLTPDMLRTAIIMVKRAPCRGDEAHKVHVCLGGLEALYCAVTELTHTQDTEKDG